MITTFIRLLTKLPLNHPKKVLWFSLFLTVISLLFIPRLHVSTDRNLLAGKDSEEYKRREQVSEMFGTSLVSVVVLTAPTMDEAKHAADALATELKKHPEFIRDVFHKADISFFENHGFMFAPKQTVDKIAESLNSGGVNLAILEDADSLSSLISSGATYLSEQSAPDNASEKEIDEGFRFIEDLLTDIETWFSDPDKTTLAIVDKMMQTASPFQGKGDPSGYLTDNDYKSPSLLVMFVQPASDSGAMDKVAPLTDLIREKSRLIEQDFKGVKTYVSGMPSLQTDELRLVSRDSLVSGICAGLGVLLIFLIAFRSIRVTLFLVLPLGVGLIWSAGFTGAVYGHLTMITSYFAAVLFGLGVAFTIHIVARFHEALIDGEDKIKALETAMISSGPGVFVGGATTALAFLAIVFSEFKGFAEMGVISGVGVTLILLANLTLLPAALILWHPGLNAVAVKKRTGNIWDTISSSRIVVPLVTLLLFIAGLYFAKDIKFNYAVESMLPESSDAVKAIKLMNDRTDFSSMYSVSVASSLDEAKIKAAKLKELSTVSRADTLSDYVPDGQSDKVAALKSINRAQADKIKSIAEKFAEKKDNLKPSSAKDVAGSINELGDTLEDLAFDARRAGRSEYEGLNKLAQKAHETAEIVKKGSDKKAEQLEKLIFSLISKGLSVFSTALDDKGFTWKDLPQNIKGRFVSKDEKHFAIFVYPKGDIGQKDFFYKHVDELESSDPEITGHVVTHKRFTKMVHQGFIQAVIWSLLAVVILVVFDLRSFKGILMALGPVVISAGLTALFMSLTGFMLNYANLMALPILIGTGVDYGVHMAHRMQQSNDIVIAVRTTGRAIALSGLTTLIGFGSLLLGNHWGVRSLGILLVTGIFFALAAALVVMPGLLRNSKRKEI
ncbi:MAG: MMPL family transporter [Deltaproteobacteria bacterium]|nr:MMPL family transporter [Deltaproteobacteria bacterium]